MTVLLKKIRSFQTAARKGRSALVSRMLKKDSAEAVEMIAADNYWAFRYAAIYGHLGVIEAIWFRSAPDAIRAMIAENHYDAFRRAASEGHLGVIEAIWSRSSPHAIRAMITADYYGAFSSAAEHGHLAVVEAIWSRSSPHAILAMIATNNYWAFCEAAENGHLAVMEAILSRVSSDTLPILLQTTNALGWSVRDALEYRAIADRLLGFPYVLAYAEQHGDEREYRDAVKRFIKQKLAALHARQAAHHSSVVLTRQEAEICFYILRHFIRRPAPASKATLKEIRFLINIPCVRELLHRPVSPDAPNELLRLAMSQNNQAVSALLLEVPAVFETAESQAFYADAQVTGSLDLMALVQNRESSLTALSASEEQALQRLRDHYQHSLQGSTHQVLLQPMRQALRARYQLQPAILTNDQGIEVALPCDWNAFVALELTAAEEVRAFQAYFQHPTHTVLRYVSKPNRWMAPNALYVRGNERAGYYAAFEEYADMLALLWAAATDSAAPPTVGYTIDSRIEMFIRSVALIARAHNWDRTRSIINVRGQQVSEEYDDLDGDKPSCYSGVKRRLFEALQGHPDFIGDLTNYCQLYFKEQVRVYMQDAFERMETSALMTHCVEYSRRTQGNSQESFKALDIPEPMLTQWMQALQNQLSRVLTARDPLIARVRQAFFNTDFHESHFLAFVSRLGLDTLALQILERCEDGLMHLVKTRSGIDLSADLQAYTPGTHIPQLISAIELGLLGKIGERLGAEAFAQLLNHTDLRPVYVERLSSYAEEQVEAWLSALSEEDKADWMQAYHAEIQGTVEPISPATHFQGFLNAWQADGAIQALQRAIAAEQDKYLEVTQAWLAKNPKHRQTLLIRNYLKHYASSEAQEVVIQPTQVTYEDLPDDVDGLLLPALEASLQFPASKYWPKFLVGSFLLTALVFMTSVLVTVLGALTLPGFLLGLGLVGGSVVLASLVSGGAAIVGLGLTEGIYLREKDAPSPTKTPEPVSQSHHASPLVSPRADVSPRNDTLQFSRSP